MCGYIHDLAAYRMSYSCSFDTWDFGIYTNTRDIFYKAVAMLFDNLQNLIVPLFKTLN